MADWGADVTWLENTGAGDTIRDTAYIKQAIDGGFQFYKVQNAD